MMVGSFRIETGRSPLITVMYGSVTTEVDFRRLFQMYNELCSGGTPLGFVIDFRAFDPVRAPRGLSHVASSVWAEHADVLRRSVVCEARVVTNRISRGTLTAFDCFTLNKWPCANFGTRAEADAWVCKRLERHGVLPVVSGLDALALALDG